MAQQPNYYNYFTEVEEHFVRRRGKHMYLSPLDWTLIETWKEAGIPLHIVIRGIDRAFDAYEAKPVKTRLVNSIFYCHQEVLSAFEEYLEAHVGQSHQCEDQASAPWREDKERILAFLDQKIVELTRAREAAKGRVDPACDEKFSRAIARLQDIKGDLSRPELASPNYEALERDLSIIDNMLLDALEAEIAEDTKRMWEEEAKKDLKPYKKNLSPEVYQKILRNYLRKKAREQFALPNLSLFYA